MTVLERWTVTLSYLKAHFNPSNYMDISVLETEKNSCGCEGSEKVIYVSQGKFYRCTRIWSCQNMYEPEMVNSVRLSRRELIWAVNTRREEDIKIVPAEDRAEFQKVCDELLEFLLSIYDKYSAE